MFSGVQMTNDRVKWVNFDEALNSQLQTSGIINLDYKDIKSSLIMPVLNLNLILKKL